MPSFKEVLDYFETKHKFSSKFAEDTYRKAIEHNDKKWQLFIASEELKKAIQYEGEN